MDLSKLEKKYYTIGEVANLFGVSTSLIRYWEKHFKQLTPQKTKQGIRKYTISDIEQFKIIYQLVKQQGYTIKGAQEMLRNESYGSSKRHKALIQTLKEISEFFKILQQNT